MKVYTKTGDGGTTSLIGGERVSKADPRVEAYGSVDELSAFLALLGDTMAGDAEGRFAEFGGMLDEVQRDLFAIEAVLATGTGGGAKVKPLPREAIERLERQIDELSDGLPPVAGFTIPGGHPIVSMCHVCRTVCRRAERVSIRSMESREASGSQQISSTAVEYLNRLSDLLYVVGRRVVETLSIKERFWLP
ncbi:MAG: cob(I)yrinic acid a,c-diamide adenosyltransferase [Alistipes sp.]|jgi:cob(I)alamin adenosyltransferase|nr:cob(I)yrinic acid a,c-diamide adenosyltransferase [Alistipes sp.]